MTPRQLPTREPSILITGCSSGIGYSTAHALHLRGYRVFASARNPADVTTLKEEGLEALQLDLNSSQSISAAVAEVLERTNGQLFALFNNGAFGQPGAVEDLTTEVLRQQFETNLFGTHELTRQIIPVMRRQGGGRIIQNSSLLGLVALPFRGAYNASKYALEGLSDTLRLELKGSGIDLILIEPGPITSQFRHNALQLFLQNIDTDNSPFTATYRQLLNRLNHIGPTAPFTLPPEAVVEKVIQALESPSPRARYRVTLPTTLFATARRLLPTSWLDRLLLAVSRSENRH
ncbi:MAG: SDR family oxidoreductase [Gammaproteobacteria bacterium]|nr:SDR family oxidoreductase [Gammaproteobacteria bacterium]